MTSKRIEKFKEVVRQRQGNLTVILEDVGDPHNIGAVLRTCDAVGIGEIYVLYTRIRKEQLLLGKRSSSSARKWVDVHLYNDRAACFKAVKSKYAKIYATHLSESAKNLYDLDLTTSLALLFGNERYGVSQASLDYCDGNFVVPQMGMVESLNISVACAVTLYEAARQRRVKGFYDKHPILTTGEQAALYDVYVRRSFSLVKTEAPWNRAMQQDGT